ncbi:MAG: MFS transporter [Spirochaetes bacterium]|nr:MFS transporter [Spirochaetota bacterium]
MKKKYLAALTAGHIFTDMNQGALPAMLPFIIVAGGLGYARAAGLVFATAIASSLSQPLFGILADKVQRSWMMPFGVLLAGGGLALIGFFPNDYWLMFAAALLAGIGVAAFHPDGARMANRMAGKQKGKGMGFFSMGGTLGVAVGPLIATPALVHFGLRGSAVLFFPAAIMCVILLFLYRRMHELADTTERAIAPPAGELKNEWGKFSWLSLAITCRSTISHSFNVFIPLYWINVLNQSIASGAMIVSFMMAIGAVTVVLSGYLADRFGMVRIMKLGWFILLPSVFFLTSVQSPAFALLMLVPVTVGNFLVNTPTVVLGQQYLPKNVGFASGITLGLGVSIGGVFTPLLGRYAEVYGLAATFNLIAILPVIGLVVAFTSKLPRQA